MNWAVGAVVVIALVIGIRGIFKQLKPPSNFRKHIDTYYNDTEDETKP